MHRPVREQSELTRYLGQISRFPLDEPSLWRAGSAAWLLDESDLAVTLLQDAMQRLQGPGMRGTSGPGLTALGMGIYRHRTLGRGPGSGH